MRAEPGAAAKEERVDQAVDAINRATMRSAEAVRTYSGRNQLQPREAAALASVADMARGQPLLDLGVGAGRTVEPLLAVSQDYLGLDYSPEMIEVCRRRYPQQRFVLGDARRMPEIADGSMALVMFSANGICMVSHQDRLAILREIHRVLRPGGAAVLSTYNQHCRDESAGFQLPELQPSLNPVKMAVRTGRFLRSLALRRANWARHREHVVRTPEYSLINDVCHDYGVMLYYISLENQRRQLEACGFLPGAEAFDHAGRRMERENDENDYGIVARKPG